MLGRITRLNGSRLYTRLYSSEPPVMGEVRGLLKTAMRSGNKPAKDAIRAVMATVKNHNIEAPGSLVSDIGFHGCISKMISKRQKSSDEYASAGRDDLVANEQAQIKVLEELQGLVSLSDDGEVEKKVREVINSLQSSGPVTMGQVMKSLPRDIENSWNTSHSTAAKIVKKLIVGGTRKFSTSRIVSSHENPLGIPAKRQVIRHSFKQRGIDNVEKIVAVSSAKGGVGKSTVAVNLALSLFEKGYSVGILDVDLFGPSLPTLLNLKDSGEVKLSNDGTMLLPKENYGLQAMSMGFLIDQNKALAWRGLLIQKALQQLLFEVKWRHLDYLIIDMPPGTGDIQLSLAQQVKIDGAVIVSTPQDVALVDVIRGVDMYHKVGTPILGLVQNMSVYVCPSCNHESHIFGHDGALKLAAQRGLDLLGSIPIDTEICESSDSGKPVTVYNKKGPSSLAYAGVASKVLSKFEPK